MGHIGMAGSYLTYQHSHLHIVWNFPLPGYRFPEEGFSVLFRVYIDLASTPRLALHCCQRFSSWFSTSLYRTLCVRSLNSLEADNLEPAVFESSSRLSDCEINFVRERLSDDLVYISRSFCPLWDWQLELHPSWRCMLKLAESKTRFYLITGISRDADIVARLEGFICSKCESYSSFPLSKSSSKCLILKRVLKISFDVWFHPSISSICYKLFSQITLSIWSGWKGRLTAKAISCMGDEHLSESHCQDI